MTETQSQTLLRKLQTIQFESWNQLYNEQKENKIWGLYKYFRKHLIIRR